MESFSAKANLARVGKGFSGGNFFSKPITAPKMTFVNGWPSEVSAKMDFASIPSPKVLDAWSLRRANAGGS